MLNWLNVLLGLLTLEGLILLILINITSLNLNLYICRILSMHNEGKLKIDLSFLIYEPIEIIRL